MFKNRLIGKNRPEYSNFLQWLNLSEGSPSPFSILSITGGLKKTDPLEVFPCPVLNEKKKYEIDFFSRGIRYLPKENQEQIGCLKPGDQLYLLKDVQNQYDTKALLMRTGEPMSIAGYCPKYFNHDFYRLLDKSPTASVTVIRSNPDAPFQMRLLCKFESEWPDGFEPFGDDNYLPINK